MKSLGAMDFAAGQAEKVNYPAAVRRNPLALFTDFQWFLYRARNTVYFTAFSKQSYDRAALITLVANMVTLAPQLTHGFKGARPGEPLPAHLLEAITTLEYVDELGEVPDPWLEPGTELFENRELPLFRVKAIVRKNGPDAQGRASLLLIRSSHALMEGADSALLTRSQFTGHPDAPAGPNPIPLRKRLKYGALAAVSTPLHLIAAHFAAPPREAMGFKSLVIPRHRLRTLSNRLGVSQRALMFTLVLHALNDGGRGFSDKKIRTSYTMLDGDRSTSTDSFFRVRSINVDFDVIDAPQQFAAEVDARLKQVENQDITPMQLTLQGIFKAHRFLSKVFPFFYTRRFFRFNGTYDVVLTLVPPHRIYGNLTDGMMEPVFCGSYHPGTQLCTFVPAREHITLNFAMHEKHLRNVARVNALLETLETA